MKLFFLWIFILFLIFVWGFYAIATIHSKKFINFSKHMWKVNSFLFIFLLFLTISGLLLILFSDIKFNFSWLGSAWWVKIPAWNSTFIENQDY